MEWRARRWRKLLDLIDQLPRSSRLIEAMAADMELAEEIVKSSGDDDPLPRRRVSEYTPEVELLSMIFDRLGDVVQTQLAVHGVKPKKLQPAPRPVTALQKAKNNQRKERHLSLVAQLLPQKFAGAPDSQ